MVRSNADRLASVVSRALGVDVPIRIRAWDCSEHGPPDAPTVVVHSRRALRHLVWQPGELGLARAYVSGDLDIEGDLTDALRSVWTAGATRPGPRRLVGQLTPMVRLGAATGRTPATATVTATVPVDSPQRSAPSSTSSVASWHSRRARTSSTSGAAGVR